MEMEIAREKRTALEERFFGRDFFLACSATFLQFASFLVLTATLPLYVKTIGGKESDVGLVIGFFAVSAVLCRPVIGRWVDTVGGKPFMLAGCGVFCVSSLLYNLVDRVLVLLPLRIIHGTGVAFYTTATSALIADLVPMERRGEGMGFYSVSPSLAMAIGPPLGWWIMNHLGFVWLFLASALMSFVAMVLSGLIVADPQREQSPAQTRKSERRLFPRRALFPAFVYVFPAIAQGSLLSFLPLLAESRGGANPGLFFSTSAIALIMTRSVSGRMSDRLGRRAMITPGMAVIGCSTAILGFSSTFAAILATGFMYGLGLGMTGTSMMALTVDRALPQERGSSIATVSAAWETGIGIGSMSLGFLLRATSFEVLYLFTGALVLIAAGIFAVGAYRDW
jgi:predicted MFS family arabinose efflux permease